MPIEIIIYFFVLILHWIFFFSIFLFQRKNYNQLKSNLEKVVLENQFCEKNIQEQKTLLEKEIHFEKLQKESLKEDKLILEKKIESFYQKINNLEKLAQSLEKDLGFEKERAQDFEKQKKILIQELKLLSQEQLDRNQKTFGKEIEAYMKNVNLNFSKDFVIQKNEIQKIQTFQKSLDQIIKNTLQDFHSMKDLLASFKESHDHFIRLLHPASIKHRGDWGEWNLQTIFDKMDFKESLHYDKQFYLEANNENEKAIRLDYILYLPNQMSLIIDCKTPSLPFIDFKEKKNSLNDIKAEKKRYLDQFEQILKDLVRKDYPNRLRKSGFKYQPMDYQFVFLPNQILYNFVLEEQQLIYYAFEHKILFASPGTMISYLAIFYDAWKTFNLYSEIQENIHLIREISQELGKSYYCIFDIGNDLENLRKSYNRIVMAYKKSDIEKLLLKYDQIQKTRLKHPKYIKPMDQNIKSLNVKPLRNT